MRGTAAARAAILACAVGACSQPGTQVPRSQAAKLDVAASRISVACGYEEELTAFGRRQPQGLGFVASIATSGAHKLAAVYRQDPTGIYQGESVGAIVHDSISLLAGCRLSGARLILRHALTAGR